MTAITVWLFQDQRGEREAAFHWGNESVLLYKAPVNN